MLKRATTVVLVLFMVIAAVGGAKADDAPLDRLPLMFKASEVLPRNMLSGPGFMVRDEVISDGLINIYDLVTPRGTIRVESTALLEKRIGEARALFYMEKMENTEVFKDAFKEALKGPVKTAKGLVTAPVETVSNSVKGVGRWFSSVGQAVFSDSPDQEGVAKTAIGHASTKRVFAYEFGIDPYTRWNLVQEELNKITWAAVAGGITVKAAFHLVPDGAGYAVRGTSVANSVRKLVRDATVGDLRARCEKRLKAMGVPEDVLDTILDNPYYTPFERTLLVEELAALGKLPGRELVVAAAARANSEAVALFWRLTAQMMESYVSRGGKALRIVMLGGSPFFLTTDGRAVGLFPLDYLAWTPFLFRKEAAISRDAAQIKAITGKELWISGRISLAARQALEQRGWRLAEGVGYLPAL